MDELPYKYAQRMTPQQTVPQTSNVSSGSRIRDEPNMIAHIEMSDYFFLSPSRVITSIMQLLVSLFGLAGFALCRASVENRMEN